MGAREGEAPRSASCTTIPPPLSGLSPPPSLQEEELAREELGVFDFVFAERQPVRLFVPIAIGVPKSFVDWI